MQGSEVVAAQIGIINTTKLYNLEPEHKAEVKQLLQIIALCLYTSTFN